MPKKKPIKKQAKKSNKKTTVSNSNDRVLIFIISFALGLGLGYGVAQPTSNSSTDDMKKMSSGHQHLHKAFEIDAANAPTVKLMVTEDKKSGYNIKLMTTNFTFTPENVNGENVAGEGHAHLYVDSEKTRLYGPDFHWSGSFEGEKEFRVTLNANDHGEYSVDGKVIESGVTVKHDSDSTDHDNMHSDDHDDHMHDGDDSHMHDM